MVYGLRLNGSDGACFGIKTVTCVGLYRDTSPGEHILPGHEPSQAGPFPTPACLRATCSALSPSSPPVDAGLDRTGTREAYLPHTSSRQRSRSVQRASDKQGGTCRSIENVGTVLCSGMAHLNKPCTQRVLCICVAYRIPCWFTVCRLTRLDSACGVAE